MNVASLELCQELWNLSKWTGTDYRWYEDKGIDYVDVKGTNGLSLPAYDLGYLLRKLPNHTILTSSNEQWHITTDSLGPFHADTPEDAACKLTIELFKQRILVKGGES